jgi:hypothetical protein
MGRPFSYKFEKHGRALRFCGWWTWPELEPAMPCFATQVLSQSSLHSKQLLRFQNPLLRVFIRCNPRQCYLGKEGQVPIACPVAREAGTRPG